MNLLHTRGPVDHIILIQIEEDNYLTLRIFVLIFYFIFRSTKGKQKIEEDTGFLE